MRDNNKRRRVVARVTAAALAGGALAVVLPAAAQAGTGNGTAGACPSSRICAWEGSGYTKKFFADIAGHPNWNGCCPVQDMPAVADDDDSAYNRTSSGYFRIWEHDFYDGDLIICLRPGFASSQVAPDDKGSSHTFLSGAC